MAIQIVKYNNAFRPDVISLWERSVRATHHFLLPADIAFFKTAVEQIDFNSFEVYCAFDDNHKMAGILGVSDGKLEMLFLAPEQIGKGTGKEMLQFAIRELNVMLVDVNEDNTTARNFYEKHGFKVYDRTPLDDHGKPYPILKMKR